MKVILFVIVYEIDVRIIRIFCRFVGFNITYTITLRIFVTILFFSDIPLQSNSKVHSGFISYPIQSKPNVVWLSSSARNSDEGHSPGA